MYISNAGFPETGSIASQGETPAAINGASDVNFFNAQLNPIGQHGKPPQPSTTANPLAIGAPDATVAYKRVKRGMRDTLLNKQTKDAHALPEALAAANLDVVARVKVLGSLVKGVDKISTMG